MIAVDTNVIVRYLTSDHKELAARARHLIDGADVWVPITVLLETEWVLRSVYHFAPGAIIAALRRFAGLPRVSVDRPEQVLEALEQATDGLDFADALHLSLAGHCDAFVTFDTALAHLRPRGRPPIR